MDSYLSSLKKVKKFDLKTILPGHGRAIENPYQAIEKYIGDTYRTEDKILKLLRKKSSTVHQLTSFILNEKATDPDFWYRYLGMVDTFLTKLLNEGKVYRMMEEGKVLYYSRSG